MSATFNILQRHWIAALLSLLCFTATAHGEQRHFVIGVEDLAPYSWLDGGEYRGFSRELLDLFAQKHHYRFSYRSYPIKRLYKALLDNKVDFKYPDNSYWSTDIKGSTPFYYSQAVTPFIDGVMVLPQHRGRGINALKTLGVVAGFTPAGYLDAIHSGRIQVKEVFGVRELLAQTLAGTLDGAYVNIRIARHQLQLDGKADNALLFDQTLPFIRDYRHLSSIHHAEIIEQFDQFLREEQTAITALRSKYALD